MRFIKTEWIACCLVLVSASIANAVTMPEGAISQAKALPHDSEYAAYTEYYLGDPDSDDLRTRYYSEDGQSIAQKRLRYSVNVKHPVFEIHDFRSSTGYRVQPVDDRLRIQTLRLLENNFQAVVDVQEVLVVEPTVIDAGFHRFIQQHWQSVVNGESVRFNYLQIDEARLVPMVVRRIDCKQRKQLCVKVELKNYLQRLFVPPVLLTYDAISQKLLRYSGYGPLTSETGQAYAVTMNYEYFDRAEAENR